MKAFEMSLDTAMEFYRRCHEMGLKSIESRMALMKQMIHEKDIKVLTEQRLSDRLKGKKVLRIRKESA